MHLHALHDFGQCGWEQCAQMLGQIALSKIVPQDSSGAALLPYVHACWTIEW